MTKTTAAKNRSRLRLSTPMIVAIAVALLGCGGTVLAALISGVFAYLATRTQIDRPVAYTQTAQSNVGRENNPIDWESILFIEPKTPCPAVYVPDYLFDGQDKALWMKDNLYELRSRNELMVSPTFAVGSPNHVPIYLSIRNLAENRDWVNLAREIEVSIRYIDVAPSTAEIVDLTGCGGGASYRHFSEIPLSRDYQEYNVTSTSTDADYYTLEPGESEIFVLGFECEATGLYSIDINIPITYQGEDEIITYSGLAGVICPNLANMNYADTGETIPSGYEVIIYRVEQYEWRGSGYQSTSP